MIDLSVLVPAEGEPDAGVAMGRVARAVASLGCAVEILCITPDAQLTGLPADASVTMLPPSGPGYGAALATGLARARGTWVLTIDADILDVSRVVPDLWARRHDAEVVIGSRYIAGGSVEMPWWRRIGSRLLNGTFGRGLSLGVRDMSSGVRLYRRAVLEAAGPLPDGLDALQAMLVRVYAEGWRVLEVPFVYRADPRGTSHARAQRFATDYARTFWRLRVVDPRTFGDDSLRVLRALQFAARFEATLDDEAAAICRAIPLDDLPAERLWGEFEKLLLVAERPSIGFALARSLGVVEQLLPEMVPLYDCPQDAEWHPEGDVWTHTLMVIDEARRRNADLDRARLATVMVGAVCHDLGKPATTAMILSLIHI